MYGQSTHATGNQTNFPPSMPKAVSADSMLDRFTKSLYEATGQAGEQTRRARDIADAVFGAAPTANGGTGVDMPPQDSKGGALEREVQNLFTVLADLRVQLDRLSCI